MMRLVNGSCTIKASVGITRVKGTAVRCTVRVRSLVKEQNLEIVMTCTCKRGRELHVAGEIERGGDKRWRGREREDREGQRERDRKRKRDRERRGMDRMKYNYSFT